jgi:1-acyl-sn-glycerol-3-phosphate acyltransferase
MIRALLSFLRGTLGMLLLIIICIFFSTTILVCAGTAWLIPRSTIHDKAMHYALKLPVWWMLFNKFVLDLSTIGKWDIQSTGQLNPKGWYVLIANHSSWVDIIALGSIFKRKVPLLKFFMKKELLWQLPIAGIDCYLLGYPLMARHSREAIRKNPALKGKDLETTKKACQDFMKHPTTFMNFVEGTRSTAEKRQRQNSPYQHLLKPRAAGAAIVIAEMQDKLDGIINTTIYYDAENSSLWQILCGKVNKIHVRYEVLPVTETLIGDYHKDREFRKRFQQWLNTIWQQKDQMITAFKQSDETDR